MVKHHKPSATGIIKPATCGFCGLDVGCTLVVKGDKLLSSCSLKLAYFNYSKHEGARESALKDRLRLETEVVVAAATSQALRRSKTRPTVQNIPIPCPVDACGKTIWKYNSSPICSSTTISSLCLGAASSGSGGGGLCWRSCTSSSLWERGGGSPTI